MQIDNIVAVNELEIVEYNFFFSKFFFHLRLCSAFSFVRDFNDPELI
jgi:hypothetical protein